MKTVEKTPSPSSNEGPTKPQKSENHKAKVHKKAKSIFPTCKTCGKPKPWRWLVKGICTKCKGLSGKSAPRAKVKTAKTPTKGLHLPPIQNATFSDVENALRYVQEARKRFDQIVS